MVIVQHLFVIFLAVGMPLWDWYEIPRLKASTRPRKKVRYYAKIVFALWVCAVVAILTTTMMTVLTIHRGPGEATWLDGGRAGSAVLKGIIAGMLIMILLPAALALWNKKIQAKTVSASKKFAFILPSSRDERRWWWLVCITAGVCEEIVYRGFLLHYWHVVPWHLGLTWALVLSAVIFGLGHVYQGIAGVVQTTLIGLVFGGIFIATGSLLLPMILHTVMDLRMLAMLPEGFETA